MELSEQEIKIVTLLAVWSGIDHCCLTGLKPKKFQHDFYNALDEYEREVVDEFFTRYINYLGNKFQEEEVKNILSERFESYQTLKRPLNEK